MFCWFCPLILGVIELCSTLEASLSIEEIKLLASLPISIRCSAVECVLFIKSGPSWSRPKILDAFGLGKDRLTFRFELLLMFDACEVSFTLSPVFSCFEPWPELNLALSFADSWFAKVKLTPLFAFTFIKLFLLGFCLTRDFALLLFEFWPSMIFFWLKPSFDWFKGDLRGGSLPIEALRGPSTCSNLRALAMTSLLIETREVFEINSRFLTRSLWFASSLWNLSTNGFWWMMRWANL